METIKIIPLKANVFTIVDADLYEWLNQWTWRLSPEGYAYRYQKSSKGKFSKLYLHVLVNATPTGAKTDHKNGCKLDNRRWNLRTADNFQNARNSSKHKRGNVTSSHKGVWKSKTGKWVSQITSDRQQKHLGTFKTESEAAAAYNRAARKHHGQFARLNVLN